MLLQVIWPPTNTRPLGGNCVCIDLQLALKLASWLAVQRVPVLYQRKICVPCIIITPCGTQFNRIKTLAQLISKSHQTDYHNSSLPRSQHPGLGEKTWRWVADCSFQLSFIRTLILLLLRLFLNIFHWVGYSVG